MTNLTPSKSIDQGCLCPRCGGLIVLRDVVSPSGTYRELWCLMCARVFRHEEWEAYRPMPEVSLTRNGRGWGDRG